MTTTIEREIVFPHPREDVWRALTDSATLAQWLMPNDFDTPGHVQRSILDFFAERNRTARPIQWSYTSRKLLAKFSARQRIATG